MSAVGVPVRSRSGMKYTSRRSTYPTVDHRTATSLRYEHASDQRQPQPRAAVSVPSMVASDYQANIAAANRHHARDPQRSLKLLLTA
jgi:hypothetical protein